MARLHAAGGFGSVQFVQQGGMPSAPSSTLSGYADHRMPHALDIDEVRGWSASTASRPRWLPTGGADALELHANHDDVLQWFLSPRTNRRSDGYGGSFENRRRLLREVVESMRDHVEPPDHDRAAAVHRRDDRRRSDRRRLPSAVAAFTADGTVDYFSLDVGDNWGRISYIQPGFYDEGEWAPLAGQARSATNLPVVYVGRVTSVETAERILADGHADLVGFARAAIADPDIVVKSLRRSRAGGPAMHRPPGVHRPPRGRGLAVRLRGEPARRSRGRGATDVSRQRRARCSSSVADRQAPSSPGRWLSGATACSCGSATRRWVASWRWLPGCG